MQHTLIDVFENYQRFVAAVVNFHNVENGRAIIKCDKKLLLEACLDSEEMKQVYEQCCNLGIIENYDDEIRIQMYYQGHNVDLGKVIELVRRLAARSIWFRED